LRIKIGTLIIPYLYAQWHNTLNLVGGEAWEKITDYGKRATDN
jgi:hypothetical protein